MRRRRPRTALLERLDRTIGRLLAAPRKERGGCARGRSEPADARAAARPGCAGRLAEPSLHPIAPLEIGRASRARGPGGGAARARAQVRGQPIRWHKSHGAVRDRMVVVAG